MGQPLAMAPRDSAPILLQHGYALAGTGYPKGWNPTGGAKAQFTALAAVTSTLGARLRHVVNVGTSYGGLVGAMEVDRDQGEVNGAVLTCGLVIGGVDLMNAQLDGGHAINQLLTPSHDIPLVHLRDAAGVKASAAALQQAIAAARQTASGRARLALAAALMHVPTWRDPSAPAPTEFDARAAQQAAWLEEGIGAGPGNGLFGFMQGSRLDIETHAGGNPSWNVGVNYGALLADNEDHDLVAALYREAHLDLAADLATLSRTARVAADPEALAWMERTSIPSGRAPVPVLAMQTSADPVAPVSFLNLYAARVRAQGDGAMLRTAMVAHPGHCAFKPPEILAAVDAMRRRLDTQSWADLATPAALEATAGDAGAFVATSTAPFAIHARP